MPHASPPSNGVTNGTKKKKLSVERIYQKKTQLEHILLRPDTYIGSVEPLGQPMWVYDGEEAGMVHRDITYVPGLYKIFDEILVNAADHKQRDSKMDVIKVDIEPENNKIVIYNNGRGIDVAMHKVEKVYVPTLIFGHLLTGANFDDDEKKVVGGRNGYGAKLCNIFSTKFIVETSSKNDGKYFKQTWENNMSKAGDVIIKDATKEDFTRVTFYPDLSKFNMKELDRDIVALMTRRVYDIAGSTKGVKVFLNGKRLPIKGFKEYVECYLKGKEDEQGNPLKCAYESCGARWEIAVAMSEKGFQQVSFVNSIATTKGGRHVDHVSGLIVDKLAEVIKKKNKAGVNVKPFQLKNHLWVFVNCLIENPAFDSQTKECLNTQIQKFGSKCTPTEKFYNAALKTGIVESVMNWVKFKADTLKDKACSKAKHSKLRGIPKLEDANDAGTKNSMDCTLILTEGDSAKSLVVAGLGVVGRDKYGVFPLRGKLLNVREATSKQISENAEITSILKIMGLQYKKKYESQEDLKTLRYGRLMIMTDQDQDGSHIKGLLINFIHHNWPSLLKLPFLEEFITPIVKVSKGSTVHSFYSLPEFEEWKKETPNWSAWTVKYYKGLGTSTAAEAKEYFSNLARHRIRFRYEGTDDDNAINLAFSKKMIDARKDWLTSSMESRKMRRELGLPEVYLYAKDTKVVTYQDFVNKELVLFSNLDNERSIPSMMDGLKPGQRKVLFTCFKRNDKKEVKVAQLAGSVGEHSAYHHGEQSLMQTIIGLAQNFVGSNNINLLMPNGQFGTRLQGGKDHASPRYIFTRLSPLARKIFPHLDDPLLNYLYDDNLRVEPEYYVPIIPMVLVNGAEGIGTGWSTKIPNYNPRDIVKNLRRMLDYEDIRPLKPWFKGFRGEIDQVETSRYICNGEVAELDSNKIEITELPIRSWTQNYKETVLETMANGTEKTPQFITDYKEYHTDATVRFVITLPENNLRKAESEGIHKTFKLQTTFTTTSMVLFDSKGCLRRYDTAEEILKEFYSVRLEYYDKRKTYMIGMLEAECEKLKNQARFIEEKISGEIKLENKKKAAFIAILEERGYKSDPVKKWKKEVGIIDEKKKKNDDENEEEDAEDEDSNDSGGPSRFKKDYDYLMDMPMRSMLLEKKEELLRKRDEKISELSKLEATTIQQLWKFDLDAFLEELDKVEKKEQEEQAAGHSIKHKSLTLGKGKKGGGALSADTRPAEFGRRIAPRVDFDAYTKKEAKAKAKADAKKSTKGKRKLGSDSDTEDDEFNGLTVKDRDFSDEEDLTIIQESFNEGKSEPPASEKAAKKDEKPKKAKEDKPKKEKVEKPKKAPAKKASAKTATIDQFFQKKTIDDVVDAGSNQASEKSEEKDVYDIESIASDSSGSDWGEPKAKKVKAATKKAPVKKATAPKATAKPVAAVDDSTDEDELAVGSKQPAIAEKDESFDSPVVKRKKAPTDEGRQKAAKKARKSAFDSDSDDDFAPLAERIKSPIATGAMGATTGRIRKAVSYKMDDTDEDDD